MQNNEEKMAWQGIVFILFVVLCELSFPVAFIIGAMLK